MNNVPYSYYYNKCGNWIQLHLSNNTKQVSLSYLAYILLGYLTEVPPESVYIGLPTVGVYLHVDGFNQIQVQPLSLYGDMDWKGIVNMGTTH